MYDMWGDTVNVASRMESEGVEGKVKIAEATYDLVKLVADFKFTARNEIDIKGKGLMRTWLVDQS